MKITITRQNDIELLTAENIPVTHAFTTRLGGVSPAPFDSLNLGLHRGDNAENVAENHRRLAARLGYDLQKLVMSHQIHSDIVRAVTEKDARGIDHKAYPECDALITNTPGVALWVFTADCTPILLHDPVTGAVGAVHAGWRGTVAAIAGKTVETMVSLYGCRPENIRAAIGPNIGPCCFQTHADVPEAMESAFGTDAKPFLRPAGDKYYVNLKELNALALRAAGVRDIAISPVCTVCQHHRFWSHRYTGGVRGSQGAVIVCKEAQL
jgi:YfiH family protein